MPRLVVFLWVLVGASPAVAAPRVVIASETASRLAAEE